MKHIINEEGYIRVFKSTETKESASIQEANEVIRNLRLIGFKAVYFKGTTILFNECKRTSENSLKSTLKGKSINISYSHPFSNNIIGAMQLNLINKDTGETINDIGLKKSIAFFLNNETKLC